MTIAKITALCPGCQSKNTFAFKRPGFMEAVITTVDCGICESKLQYRIKQCPLTPDKKKSDQVNVVCRITKSPLLIELERQDAMERQEIENSKKEVAK